MEFSANDPPAIKTAVHTWIIIEVLPASITSGVYKYFSGFSGARLVYYKHFSGAGKVCINTSPAQEMRFQILPRLSGAREVYLNTSPTPQKYFYIYTHLIPLRRRRSLGSV